jgi:hypothetical protein
MSTIDFTNPPVFCPRCGREIRSLCCLTCAMARLRAADRQDPRKDRLHDLRPSHSSRRRGADAGQTGLCAPRVCAQVLRASRRGRTLAGAAADRRAALR